MTDISTQTPEAEAPEGDDNPVIAKLRKEAKEGAAAIRELEALKRDRAFDKAGVPEDGAGKWFRKGYDGDVDVEAIKAAAVADGLIASQGDTAPEVVSDALDQAGVISEAAAGTQASPTIEALMENANTIEEITAIATNAGVGVPIR